MKYINLERTVYALYDERTQSVLKTVDTSQLEDEKSHIEEQLTLIPPPPTDEQLLEWARNNYPYPENREGLEFQRRLDEINTTLEAINNEQEVTFNKVTSTTNVSPRI